MHGFFSQTAANTIGYANYTTPSGETVQVTIVCRTNEVPVDILWSDLVYVGEVVSFVSVVDLSGWREPDDFPSDYQDEIDDLYDDLYADFDCAYEHMHEDMSDDFEDYGLYDE